MLGLDSKSVGFSALTFGFGLATAALSIWSNSHQATLTPARAYENLMRAEHKRACMENIYSERAEDEYRKILDEKPAESPDFAFSKLTIFLTNSAGAIWLTGLLYVIYKVTEVSLNL